MEKFAGPVGPGILVSKMIDVHSINKELIAPLQAAMYDFDEVGGGCIARPYRARCNYSYAKSFRGYDWARQLYDNCYKPLFEAMPDLER